MNTHAFISNKVREAMTSINIPEDFDPQVKQTNRIKFGHYQVNGIISIAKKLKKSSFSLANELILKIDLQGIAKNITVIKPGFINIYLDENWLSIQLEKIFCSSRLSINVVKKPQTIVIDYSSPNLAKEMHVGHLRSTIIGDSSARILEFLGHKVIRMNHVGDWGNQFGMLIAYIIKKKIQDISLINLEKIYKKSKILYEQDINFNSESRNCLKQLQSGNVLHKKIWKKIVKVSLNNNQKIYNRLNVSLKDQHVLGESFYHNDLSKIVKDLKEKKLAEESEGAIVVFLKEYINKNGQPFGVIIQKKDGGFLYTTIDIACLKYRYETLKADRILYYIDARQHLHLMQVFNIALKANYITADLQLEHHAFGMILNDNKQPFKTRSGNTIKLIDLLNEGYKKAFKLIQMKNPCMKDLEKQKLAEIISISAIKYADLSRNRTHDYIFNWDLMLSFEGNTAPYIQYAYTRILSILKKSFVKNHEINNKIIISNTYEMQLAICLLQFEETIEKTAFLGTPHLICTYLYKISGLFSIFYENCPIINNKKMNIKKSRLKLAIITAKIIKLGLDLLGIQTIKHM
ncbi:arginine--tRNA ligase [Candidatus Tachikawaea gelatinosa]|uniref:Arginine--tRNA ligase n=1 Tax=Candidatus Tachikawaea gelatinosa TaxID=1410383 RepID=A0A090AQT7_9ENTR|nr:arginine--tRNA ligase [Candidatus Tachikawaea gelatinosa]BAP58712.1 arginine--tRNA ligase [Candidatus Tachikawaea gelatinosa]